MWRRRTFGAFLWKNQGFKISNKTTLDRLKKHFLKLPLYAADGYNGVDLYVGSKLIESLDEVADGQEAAGTCVHRDRHLMRNAR